MKNPINKRVFRQIYDRPVRIIAIFLAMLFVIVFSSAFFTSQDSVKSLYYKQLQEGKVEDGQFTTINPLTDKLIKKLEEKNIKVYKNFYIEGDQGQGKKIRAFENREEINLPQVLEGRLALSRDELAISGNYARANKLKINDQIKVQDRTFKIVGLVSLPDYSTLLRNRDDLVMDTGYFGICLLTREGFESFDELSVKYNYSYHNDSKLGEEEALDQLREIAKVINNENMVIDGVIRANNHCISYLMDDMEGDVPTMTTFMCILFIALAFISAVQVKSLIESEAPVIGTLLASGYKKKELLVNYMKMPIFLTLLAGILGNIVAYIYAFRKYVALYYNSFDLPNFEAKISFRSFLLTTMIPLLIYLLVNFFVISMSLRFSPLDFLRGKLVEEKKKSKLKLQGLSFISRLKIRMVLDNKLNIFALIFGILLANILLIFSLSIRPIIHDYAKKMSDSMKYNYTYLVKMPQEGVKAEMAHIIEGQLIDHEDKKVKVFGLERESKFNIRDYDSLKDNEIVASQGFVKRFSIKVGDEIRIKEPYKARTISLRIKDIDKENNFFQLFIPKEHLNKVLDKEEGYFNSYLSDNQLSISKDKLITEINGQEMSKTTEHFLDGFGAVFDMLFYVGIGFYLIICFIVMNTIFDRSRINISYLKVFGFSDGEIIRTYVSSIFILLIALQFIMIPVLDMLMKYLIYVSMTKLDAYIIADIPLMMYLKSILYSIIIFITIQLSQHIKLSKIDMVKELKVMNG